MNAVQLTRLVCIGIAAIPLIDLVDDIMLRSKLRRLDYNPFALPEEMGMYLDG